MMVWLMRHGRAGAAASDDERRLTREGAEAVRRVAGRLRMLGLSSPAVISSPLVRAVETAELVAQSVPASSLAVSALLRPGAGAERNMELIRGLPAGGDFVLVGHQPDMGVLAGVITGCPSLRLSPGSAVCVELQGREGAVSGRLVRAVSPEDPA